MNQDIQYTISQRQQEIAEKLNELRKLQADLNINKIRILERREKLNNQLEQLRNRGFLSY
jgi:hypothetical protein